ncbi:MAG: heme ABC exporter ATP-binding protein CcmA [Rhodospirillales bacterium]|nr:heme ABC exporter ATP-binding protein CcmA [Rhodospirillales bacterium]
MDRFTGSDLLCIRGERMVFTGLDFEVAAGGALILVGPNGSGKSSLLRLMARLLKPAAGAMAWNGEDVSDDPDAHNARLHYVGHMDAVKPVLSVAENVRFWAGLRPNGAADPQAATARALETFGISHLADIPGRFLSAGQRRRVNLARIIASPAPLWLLDEPTTALDKEAIASLEGAITRHQRGGGMVVLATHAAIEAHAPSVLDLGDFEMAEAV